MWIYPVFVVFAILLCLLLSPRSRGGYKLAALLGSIAIVCVTVFLLLGESPVLRGPETSWFRNTPWRELLSFGAMNIGMASKYPRESIE